MTSRSFSKTCHFSYFQLSGITKTNQNLWRVVDMNHADGKLLKLQQYGLNNGKHFSYDFSSLISMRNLLKTNEWSNIPGNTEWGNATGVEKVGGTNADLIEDHMLGQSFFDYSQTNIIKRIKVSANANLVRKHYENHQWEDESKNASHFIYYNLYKVKANVANPYLLQHRKTNLYGVTFFYM